MAALQHHIQRAQALPPRLLDFFKKYPPAQIASTTSIPNAPTSIAENITSYTDPAKAASLQQLLHTTTQLPNTHKTNPFTPWKNPRTGKWHAPVYSLRRQAELFKAAREHHVLSLMPISGKHPEVKEQKRIEHGLRVQGTGEGRKVKGKYWERTLRGRMEKRRIAMEGMPELVRLWKQRGHGRGWKKWPK